MIKVAGLTGPTGAGKSTVSKEFLRQGAYVVDCDKAAREIVEPQMPALKKLAEVFGDDIINFDGTLNRRLLAQRAFKDEESTRQLNSITQPAITERVRAKIKDAEKDGFKVAVIDAPVLFSSPLKDDCDAIICVTAPESERIERLLLRDNRTREEIIKRIGIQPSEEYYIKNSDIIIDNAEGVDPVPQCEGLIEKIANLKK